MGTDPEAAVGRLIMFSEDKAIGLLKRPLRPSQNLARRLASQRSEETQLFLIDFDDMPHRFMAERTFVVEKYDMVIHCSPSLPGAAV